MVLQTNNAFQNDAGQTVAVVVHNPDAATPAAAVLTQSSVPVSYADNYGVTSLGEHAFVMDMIDQRATHGQIFVDVGSKEGNIDDMLCLAIEVGRLPSPDDRNTNPDVPCVHMSFDGSNLAGSFFKVAGKIIFRPEKDVFITQVILNNGELAYEIDSIHS